MSSNKISTCLQGANIYDDKIVNKTGLGCGCDITQEIGSGNCKTQILDYDLLQQVGGIELDPTQERYDITRSAESYTQMTDELNSSLAGNMNFNIAGLRFGWNLNNLLKSKINQLDIYEYGVTMIIQKMYSLNIKPSLLTRLKDFIGILTWDEINATNETNRTDIAKIKQLYVKYGTHISTKAFYGSLYQYFLYREQNDWESDIESQLKVGMGNQISISDSDSESGYTDDVTDIDKNCYKESMKEEITRKIGGNVNISDLNEWLASCTPEKVETCALLGYSSCFGSNADSGLIPLYELLDDGDDRKNAMKQALDEYVEENSIELNTCPMVVLDAFGRHFDKKEEAPTYIYENRDGKNMKYYRLEDNIFDHVYGVTTGSFYFYYALGHLLDNAVVDMKFDEKSDIDADWEVRGDHANCGVSGCMKDRYLCIKTMNVKNDIDEINFVTGFGVKIEDSIRAISKGTTTNFHWVQNGNDWYKGLSHEKVHCVYTKDVLNKF